MSAPDPQTTTTTTIVGARQDDAVSRSRLTWIITAVILFILAAILVAIVVYWVTSSSSSAGQRYGPPVPIQPVSPSTPVQPVTPALPLRPEASKQERLPDGRYRIRWGRTGPYVGVSQKADGTTAATLVDAPAAITWTFTSTNASYVGGGQWTTPASVGLSTGGAWLLPTPILVQGGGVPLTALQAWAPMRGVALDGSIYGGALHNIAYTGCARPSGTGAVGDGLVLYGDCGVDSLNWYYEPA
ncbi:FliL incomplete domain containing protein [Pandoravirus quercus]|uniref:FliL incomplete domain containing protein n=2 Tax=Pandoravirus TaxID=2060084 RepID=A0A2U7U972_9VIRU|nr:FliL incomplete domain containing protein [Pandoravirus quercus]AVK74979.1 FliL incomplete domain containing protein [Pandoravirus quercus]QBZ81167.1 FliL superfamily incomplete domain containing protein [Pandoravirus celtis]